MSSRGTGCQSAIDPTFGIDRAQLSASTTRSDTHLHGLDGLRGVACLLVFVYHLRWAAGDPPLWIAGIDLQPMFRNCDAGVGIFFALSGLLLSIPFWRGIIDGTPAPDYRRYLWKRACRIIPAYYACLVAIYLLRGGTYTFYGAVDFLLHATFLHTFSDESYTSINGVLWTIGIEFQFYLLLPLMMLGLGKLTRRFGVSAACVLGILVTVGLGLLAKTILAAVEPGVPDRFLSPQGQVINGTIFHYLKYFAFGITGGALALRWQRQSSPAVPTAAAVIAMVGTLALLWFGFEGGWRQTAITGWPLSICTFALLAAALPSAPKVSRLFEIRPLVLAGELSYGIYLWHDLVLKAVFEGTLPGRLSGWPLFLVGGGVALFVTCLIAWISFRFLEHPALRSPYPNSTATR